MIGDYNGANVNLIRAVKVGLVRRGRRCRSAKKRKQGRASQRRRRQGEYVSHSTVNKYKTLTKQARDGKTQLTKFYYFFFNFIKFISQNNFNYKAK